MSGLTDLLAQMQGQEEEEEPRSGLQRLLADLAPDPVGPAPVVGGVEEPFAPQVDDQIEDVGFFDMARATAADAIAGPFVGLAERASLVPGGTRQALRQNFEDQRVDYLAMDPGVRRATIAGLLEGAANLVPLLPAAPAAKAVQGAAKGSKALGKVLQTDRARNLATGALVGGTEGALVGIGDTAGQEGGAGQILLSAGLGTVLGGLGTGAFKGGPEIHFGKVKDRPAVRVPPPSDASRARMESVMTDTPGKSFKERVVQGLRSTDQAFNDRYANVLNAIGTTAKEQARAKGLSRQGVRDEVAKAKDRVDAVLQLVRTENGEQWAPIFEETRLWDTKTGEIKRYGPDQDNGEALQAITESLTEQEYRDLGSYLLASRQTRNLAERQAAGEALNLDAEVTADMADELVELGQRYGVDPETGDVNYLSALAGRVRRWSQRSTLDVLENAGMISAEEKGRILAKNDEYAFFSKEEDTLTQLLKERGIEDFPEIEGRGAGKSSLGSNLLSKVKRGLDRDNKVFDPISSMAVRAAHIQKHATKQLARNQIADLVDELGGVVGDEARKIVKPTPKEAQAAGAGTRLLTSRKEVDEAGNVIEQQLFGKGGQGKNTFPVWRNGKQESYLASEGLAEVIQTMTPIQLAEAKRTILAPLRKLTEFRRAGITIGPNFAVRNPVRDQWSFYVNSRHGGIPVWDPMLSLGKRVLGHIRGDEEVAKLVADFKAGPTMQSTFVGQDISGPRDAKAVQRALRTGERSGLQKASDLIDAPRLGLGLGQRFTNWAEELTRFAEYDLARSGGRKTLAGLPIPGTRGRGEKVTPLQASLDAAEVSLNFAKAGDVSRIMNHYWMFSNANFRDTFKLKDMFQRKPLETSLKVFSGIMLPSIIHWASHRDDQEYKDRHEWEKMLFFDVPKDIGRGERAKIPRSVGTVNALFGYGTEKMLDMLHEEDPKATEKFVQQLIGQTPLEYVTPRLATTMTAIGPVIETSFNLDQFRDLPVQTPFEMQRRIPELRGQGRVGATAQAMSQLARNTGIDRPAQIILGEGTDLGSPPVARHLLRQYGGGLGRVFMENVTDPLLEGLNDASGGAMLPTAGDVVRDPPTLSTRPGVGAFISRAPVGFGSRPYIDFLQSFRKMEQVAGSIKAAEGDYRTLQDLRSRFPAAFLETRDPSTGRKRTFMTELRAFRKEIKDLREMRDQVLASGAKGDKLKDQLYYIDSLVTQKSHQANEIIRQLGF